MKLSSKKNYKEKINKSSYNEHKKTVSRIKQCSQWIELTEEDLIFLHIQRKEQRNKNNEQKDNNEVQTTGFKQ